MTNTDGQVQGLSNYQGRKRGFGIFHCECNNLWFSVCAWANTAQECRECSEWTLPYEIRKWKKNKNKKKKRADPSNAHDVRGCEMCIRLGVKCLNVHPEIPKDVWREQKKAALRLIAQKAQRNGQRQTDQPNQAVARRGPRNRGKKRQATTLQAPSSGNGQQQPKPAKPQSNHPTSTPQNPPQPKNNAPQQKNHQQLNNKQVSKTKKPTEQARPVQQRNQRRPS